eukprot:scaffold13325_cov90-Isochrysis_galbana.AAC.2
MASSRFANNTSSPRNGSCDASTACPPSSLSALSHFILLFPPARVSRRGRRNPSNPAPDAPAVYHGGGLRGGGGVRPRADRRGRRSPPGIAPAPRGCGQRGVRLHQHPGLRVEQPPPAAGALPAPPAVCRRVQGRRRLPLPRGGRRRGRGAIGAALRPAPRRRSSGEGQALTRKPLLHSAHNLRRLGLIHTAGVGRRGLAGAAVPPLVAPAVSIPVRLQVRQPWSLELTLPALVADARRGRSRLALLGLRGAGSCQGSRVETADTAAARAREVGRRRRVQQTTAIGCARRALHLFRGELVEPKA